MDKIFKNPFINALIAVLYIVVLIFAVQSTEGLELEETILMPITMLSTLVFSVALMAVLFFFTPLKLFLDNEHSEAVKFFLKTLGTFAVFLIIFVVLIFSI
jgi:hypothetical protein